MSKCRVCILLLLMNCHRATDSSAPPAAQPIEVASTLAACQTREGCEQECSSGHPAACVSAGRLYEFGHGVAADAARAYSLYDRSCALGYAGGCYNAALLLERGHGVARNPQRAHQLYALVCQMGSKTACAHAAALDISAGATAR